RPFVIAAAVRVQTGGNNPRFPEEMVEDDEAAVKADVALRQFEIVDRQARELRLNEILQIVAPVAKAAAQRERQIHLVEQFVAGHQAVEYLPGVAELNLQDRVRSAEDRSASFGQGSRGAMLRAPWQRLAACEFGFTPRSKGAEGEEGSCRDERIPRLRRIKQRAPQKHHTRLALQLLHERLRRV